MSYCKKLNLSIRLNKNSSVELEIKEIKHTFMLINLFWECQPFLLSYEIQICTHSWIHNSVERRDILKNGFIVDKHNSKL